MASKWLDYLPALEKAISVMSSEIESVRFGGAWSPDHKTEGLQALQQLRQAWIQGQIAKTAFDTLKRLSVFDDLSGNIRFRASLEVIEQWSSELQEEVSVCNSRVN